MPSTIQIGDTGEAVRECQRLLTAHQYELTVDGVFGSGTESKVMQFQRAKSLAADGVVGPATWAALYEEPTNALPEPPQPLPPVLIHLMSLGHRVVWRGDYHLNLFGIRNPEANSNSFDDTLGVAYTVNGKWRVHYWPGTTDPGFFHRENPSKVSGVAALVEDQYIDTWMIDLHAGKYEALCQRGNTVRVYRDDNRDTILDLDKDTIEEGWFGINIHRSSISGQSSEVGKWSAGCQVHATLDGFNQKMALATKQLEHLGLDRFTYTLMPQWW